MPAKKPKNKSKEKGLAVMKSTPIAKLNESDHEALSEVFDHKENVQNVNAQMPQIKILHGKDAPMTFFDQNSGDKFDTFRAILLQQSPCNAWWKIDIGQSGGGDFPDCFSPDAKKPIAMDENKKPQSPACFNCPKNQFGSDRKGSKGKDCKNSWVMHVLVEGETLPKRVVLPPTSLKPIQNYLVWLSSQKRPIHHAVVIAEFSLKKKTKGSMEYSELIIEAKEIVTPTTATQIKSMIDNYREAFGSAITDQDN